MATQDQTTPRANTLFDDSDDIQKQLDNEARDRAKYGKPQTIWVFHLPPENSIYSINTEVTRSVRDTIDLLTLIPLDDINIVRKDVDRNEKDEDIKDWSYKDQHEWGKMFPSCNGMSQSPVDLPHDGLVKARAGRKMLFINYDKIPNNMLLQNDGKKVTVFGDWSKSDHPLVYGGAAHSRLYVFHSLSLHWPSEHSIGTLQYPIESQALFISSIYPSFQDAMEASANDPLAFLGISTLYKFGDRSHDGIAHLIKATLVSQYGNNSIPSHSLDYFSPSFKEYVTYQGSLTTPPCTEAVLWLVRARALTVARELIDAIEDTSVHSQSLQFNFRRTQRLNDRRVFIFN